MERRGFLGALVGLIGVGALAKFLPARLARPRVVRTMVPTGPGRGEWALIDGEVTCSQRFDGQLYVGTDRGLFCLNQAREWHDVIDAQHPIRTLEVQDWGAPYGTVLRIRYVSPPPQGALFAIGTHGSRRLA